MSRLFVAVWPPAEVTTLLAELPLADEPGVRFVAPENWHVTLRFLGDADPAEAIGALDNAVIERAQARLGPSVKRLAKRSLVVPVSGVETLATTIAHHTGHLGAPPGEHFSGHLTLARLKTHSARARLFGTPIDAAFDVDQIALVESELGPTGSRYHTLARWPLRRRSGPGTGRARQ
jgi:2'-5' RNA ligase